MQVWPRGRRNEEKQVGLSVVRIEAGARVDMGVEEGTRMSIVTQKTRLASLDDE